MATLIYNCGDLAIGDVVLTPRNLRAEVVLIGPSGYVGLRYLDDCGAKPATRSDYVRLRPHCLRMVRRAAGHGVPDSFFSDD